MSLKDPSPILNSVMPRKHRAASMSCPASGHIAPKEIICSLGSTLESLNKGRRRRQRNLRSHFCNHFLKLFQVITLAKCVLVILESIWNQNSWNKKTKLNKHILRFIFKDFNTEYNNLLKRAGTANLKGKRLQNRILTIFKCLPFSDYPRYLKVSFTL